MKSHAFGILMSEIIDYFTLYESVTKMKQNKFERCWHAAELL